VRSSSVVDALELYLETQADGSSATPTSPAYPDTLSIQYATCARAGESEQQSLMRNA
jgi:hypothetical protein